MRDMVEVALAIWPWWTGVLLFVWWASLLEGVREVQERGDEDPLALARGLVTALTLMVTLAWVVGVVLWLP
jgi:hypothetical protein